MLSTSMIARLQGNVVFKEPSFIIVDVNGVGYKVHVPSHVFLQIKQSEEVVLFTHTHVREDLLELYGFLAYADLKLFGMLLSVSGIGCKTAMGVFANGTREEIMGAILSANVAFFSGIPRLGKKNAQKIIIELKSKLGEGGELDLSDDTGDEGNEVIAALQSIGYSGKEAHEAMRAIGDEGKTTGDRVRLALKYLGK